MTPENINAAMAELDGWKDQHPLGEHRVEYRWLNPNGFAYSEHIPDYYSDLNAVARMEKLLDNETNIIPSEGFDTQFGMYIGMLEEVVGPTVAEDDIYAAVIIATAPQRCEAILRTLGKWKD